MSVGVLTTQAKCDFSKVKFEKYNQQGNEMYFRTNIDEDSCIYFYFTAYDYQLKKLDTIQGWGNTVGVSFNAKGKYKMMLNVVDECNECAAVLVIEINITIFGKVALDYKPSVKNCKFYEFGMTDFKDTTCMEYYHVVWNADKYIKGLSEAEWETVSYVELYNKYSFQDYETYNEKSIRTWKHEFVDSGRYLVTTTYLNKCTGIDTFTIHKLDVCKPSKSTNTKPIINATNIKVVGYYDMLGRQVDYMEPNKIYIVIYNNGHRQKSMRCE